MVLQKCGTLTKSNNDATAACRLLELSQADDFGSVHKITIAGYQNKMVDRDVKRQRMLRTKLLRNESASGRW